jgi:Tfp pilus assembly protein PilO
MTLNRREQTLAAAVAGLVLLLVTYGVGAAMAAHGRETSRKITARQRELASVQAAIRSRPEWLAQTEHLRQGLRRQQHFEKEFDLLKQIEDTSKAAGVSISGRRELLPVDHGNYREMAVQCSFEAGIQSLVQFLFALQTETGLITVEQIQIAPRPDNVSILRGDIQVRAVTERQGKAKTPS